MIIKNLAISNLFSFVDSKVSFGKFNVIAGPNAAGKSNIVRILKILIRSPQYGFNFYIDDFEKHDKNQDSQINLDLELSDQECNLISNLIFRRTDPRVSNMQLLVKWSGERQIKQKVKMAIIFYGNVIIWNDCNEDKFCIIDDISQDKDLFAKLGKIRKITDQEITNYSVGLEDILAQPTQPTFNFRIGSDHVYTTYHQKKDELIDRQVYDYCELPFNTGIITSFLMVIRQ